MASDVLLTFDRFRLDFSTGRLVGPSGPIALTPKALAMLEYLAARPGRLMSKRELLDALWPACSSPTAPSRSASARSGAPWVTTRRRRGSSRPRTGAATGSSPSHRHVHAGGCMRRIGPPAEHRLPPLPVQLRAQRRREHRLSGAAAADRSISCSSWAGCRISITSGESRRSRGSCSRLASFSRLILFDKRGTGLSDPVTAAADARAAHGRRARGMDAVGSRRAVLLGVSEGGPMCSLFAATLSGTDRSADHDRHLRAAAAGARLSMGADARGARGVLPRDARRTGAARSASRSRAERGRTIPRSASGGRRTCAWARARRPRSRSPG